jgi:Tfp pilus assembly protein PilF
MYPEMAIGGSFQHSPRKARRRRGVSPPLALIVIAVLAATLAAQQPPPRRTNPKAAPQASSPFLEAETLLRQGSIAEAKVKIEEQLKIDPSNVEGYNLLGIVYSNEID